MKQNTKTKHKQQILAEKIIIKISHTATKTLRAAEPNNSKNEIKIIIKTKMKTKNEKRKTKAKSQRAKEPKNTFLLIGGTRNWWVNHWKHCCQKMEEICERRLLFTFIVARIIVVFHHRHYCRNVLMPIRVPRQFKGVLRDTMSVYRTIPAILSPQTP